jgi:CheY-like chemotaxis protein
LNGSHRILIVEDDKDIAKIYSMILEAQNYVVATAYNADEALAKVLEFQPDAILLDIMIPGMDGLEVLKKIRTEPQFVQTQPRIIITTNIAQQDKADIAKKNGAQGYLVKANIDPHDLAPIVGELLGGSSSASEENLRFSPGS